MNKTVTINIAGLVFHIDEDAYNKLDSYINAVRNSIQQEGEDEIIADIEARIAELFSERIDPQSGVIRMNNVDEIINIMGKPEDYIIEEEPNTNYHYSSNPKQAKKIYRDGEKRILGGVCSGLGHYLNVDPVWIRIIFVLLLFLYGSSFIIYFVLWIIIPKARTVADVLEMKGQPVNISNIERQFREGISNSYQTLKTNGKSAADVIRKFIGTSLIIFGSICVFGSFFVPIGFSSEQISLFNLDSIEYLNDVWVLPFWLLSLCLFLVSCLPFVLIILLGVKILKPKTKYIGLTSAILGFIWMVALFLFTYTMINSDREYQQVRKTLTNDFFNKEISKVDLLLNDKDTLNIIFDRDPRIYNINDTITNGYKYGEINDVNVGIFESSTGKAYMEIEEHTFNKSSLQMEVQVDFRKKIDNIPFSSTLKYNYSVKSDTLVLSNAILATKNDFTEDNKVQVKVYILPSQKVKLNGNDRHYFWNNHIDRGQHYYLFNNEGRLQNTDNSIN